MILSIVFVSSCGNKYEDQYYKYWNDYEILFLEIVKPSLDIEDGDEFMDYYASEDIIKKVEQAEMILNEIEKIVDEHNLKSKITGEPAITSTPSMTLLTDMTTAKERYKDYEDKYVRTYPVNGSVGYKSQIKRTVERYEENIKNYNEWYGITD